MLPRSLRLLLDGAGDAGVTLSAFRARDPEPGWDPPTAEQVSGGGGAGRIPPTHPTPTLPGWVLLCFGGARGVAPAGTRGRVAERRPTRVCLARLVCLRHPVQLQGSAAPLRLALRVAPRKALLACLLASAVGARSAPTKPPGDGRGSRNPAGPVLGKCRRAWKGPGGGEAEGERPREKQRRGGKEAGRAPGSVGGKSPGPRCAPHLGGSLRLSLAAPPAFPKRAPSGAAAGARWGAGAGAGPMKVFLRLGGCLEAGGSPEGVLLTRTRWYCLPAKTPVTLWEESGDGVIYTVTCRSPGGAHSPVGGSDGGGEEASPSEPPSPGQCRVLKAAQLPALVRHLLEAPALGDPCYVPAFLATYRTFTDPRLVLAQLLERLQEIEDSGPEVAPGRTELQRVLGSLLCSWLDGYPEDFAGLEPGLREQTLARLRWALGSGSEHEKSLAPALPKGAPLAREQPEGDEAIAGDEDADPHYILGLQADEVAAHLTAQDADLFLCLVPHECLGSLWSQRDKKGHEGACPTVRATVAQFNRVANAVVASCLSDTGLRAAQRARLLEKWIRVAEECLSLRNFSSLYAVVSALQSTSLHRLKRTWEETSRDCIHCYEELSAICSEKDNYRQSRQLLFQEGCPSAEPAQRRHQRKTLEQRPTGVVPYLGTFLKDLVMLDAATRNRLANGYINFEKHRKEFEILTQLRLLQAACRNYTLRPDRTFQRWLQRLPRLTEGQSYQLSCAIEPLGEGGTPTRAVKPSVVITHCTDMLSSMAIGMSMSWDKPGSPQASCELMLSPAPSLAQQTKWPSVSVLDRATEDDEPSSPGGLAPPPPAKGGGFIRGHRRSASCGSAYPKAPAPGSASASECRFIRVRMELQNGTLYKSVVVTSQDKAPAVIVKVLEKHNQDRCQAPNYELVQLLGEGRELAFPPTANIFYAMNSSSLDFVLRRKRPPDSAPPPPPPPRTPAPRGTEVHATFPKIKATGRKIVKAFF